MHFSRPSAEVTLPAPGEPSESFSAGSKWGAVALGVLGAVGLVGTVSAVMQPPDMQHELLILDDFRGEHSHGESVEQALKGTNTCGPGTSREVRRVPVDLVQGLDKLDTPGALDNYVRNRFLVPMGYTTRALEEVQGRAVLHQSQGASESRIVESLWGRASWDKDFRGDLARQLGVSSSSDDKQLGQALLDRVHAIHGEPAVASARAALLEAAEGATSRGAIRVLTAGNQGVLSRTFETLGVQVPEGFYRSDLADPAAVIVGASDDHGTADPSDDTVAGLASPDAGAVVAMDGVDRPVCINGKQETQSGSSHAGPQVSKLLDEAWTASPGASREELIARLQASVRPVPGGEAWVGRGIVDPEGFLLSK